MKDQSRRLALLASAASVSLMLAPAAWAQAPAAQAAAPLPTAPQADDQGAVEAVVVTGTRLQASGFTTPTPVTVVGSGLIEQRAKSNLADALNEIPSFVPTSGPQQATRNSTGATAASYTDLRGLGPQRTLTLLDGRRVVPFYTTGAVDVSMIPTNLVDRVEVVTGGASAQYGSDAVAGVVNFILKDRMEGVTANVQGGISQRGDAQNYSINLAAGHSFMDGRLHVIAGADFNRQDGIANAYSRDWGAKDPGQIGLASNHAALGLPANLITYGADYSGATPGGIINNGPLRGTAFLPGVTPYQFQYGNPVGPTEMAGGGNYMITEGGTLHLLNPTHQFSTLGRVNFDLTPTTTLYAEGSYAREWIHSRSLVLVDQNVLTVGQIGLENPFLPPSIRAALQSQVSPTNPNPGFQLGRYHTEMGAFEGINTTNIWRGVLGAKGELFNNWKWDLYGEIGQTNVSNDERTWNVPREIQSMYAVTGADGQPACGPIASNPYFKTLSGVALQNALAALGTNCAPFNPFGAGSPSQAAVNYIRADTDQPLRMKQYVMSASITGSPFSTWAGPVSTAFGGEWRNDTVYAGYDPLAYTAEYWGFDNPTLSGSQKVYEFFGETGIPLAKDMTLAKSLAFNGAIRETHYNRSGWVTTWKVGGEWEPTDWLRFRTTKSRDIRAPHMNELFQSGGGAYNIVTNPGNGVTDTILSPTKGNPNLRPEVADTFTAGGVFQPKWDWASGFRLSVDYFHINLNGVIGTVGVTQILQRYYTLHQTQYASQIHFCGSLIGICQIDVQYQNLNQLETDGLDIEAAYRVPLEKFNVPGRFDVNFLMSYTHHLTTTDTSGAVVTSTDRAGWTVPKWKENLRLTYTLDKLQVQTQARIFSGILFNGLLVDPQQPGYSITANNSINDNHMPPEVYWSLSASYKLIQNGRQDLQVYAVMDNVFDKDPPIQILEEEKGGGVPYDTVGRSFKVGVRMSF